MAWEPISKQWPGKRAILLVHGVGDQSEGCYQDEMDALAAIADLNLDEFAVYPFEYDFIIDWMKKKAQFEDLVKTLKSKLGVEFGGSELDKEVAERVGDVIAPILSLDVRAAVRTAYLAQLEQLVLDGTEGGSRVSSLKISIICHSFGCLQTYEAVHAAARHPALMPATRGVRFANAIFMASPVQLVRSVAERLGIVVPAPGDLAALAGDRLTQPFERTPSRDVMSVKNWVSITGNLDPAGGYLLGNKLDWAYMDVEGQDSYVDDQVGSLNL
ncbi:hypothetical protein KAW64_11580, partial [bacterium]|nr:hypothetical protein [bacterium]